MGEAAHRRYTLDRKSDALKYTNRPTMGLNDKYIK